MSITTINATIQMRHGLEQDLDSDQLTVGEWAVSTDKKYVRMCFAPGIVIRMATYESFEQDMLEIQTILATCQEIQTAVDEMAKLAEQHKNDAENYAKLSESWAHGDTGERDGENTDNSKYWSDQSKVEADRAKSEADRASSIAGIDIDSELSETSTNPVQNKVITKALSEVSIDISNESVEFTESETRSNIQSGEKIPILFGKIKKWFTDFADVAFSGNYNDLSDTPAIPTIPDSLKNPNSLTFTGADTGSYDGSEEKTVHIPSGVNNLLATVSGFWLDATQGKALDDKITELNGKTYVVGKEYQFYPNWSQNTSWGVFRAFIPIPNADEINISVQSVSYGTDSAWVNIMPNIQIVSGGVVLTIADSNVRGRCAKVVLTITS